MDTDWLEVSTVTTRGEVELTEAWLFAAGALSVTLKDSADDGDLSHAVLEPVPGEVKLWEEVTVVGLFEQGMSLDKLQSQLLLGAADLGLGCPVYQIEVLGDREWSRVWLDSYQPMQFGKHLWVIPTESDIPAKDAMVLRLDPGLAFGTGTHATTAQCLSWLGRQTASTRQPLEGLEVVDYGCGSGVLAIASLILGAKTAWAVDIDPQALLSSKENALRNNVLSHLHIMQPNALPCRQVDVLMANILFKPLMELVDTFADLVKPGVRLVLSGILVEQIEPLSLRYNHVFSFEPAESKEGWALLTAIRS